MDAHAYIAALPGHASPLDGERLLWQQHDGARVVVLPAAEAVVLGQAARFETRDQHLEAIVAATGLPRERVDAALSRLLGLGLLKPLAEFVPAAADAPPPPAPLLCIRTCQRPDSLARLLQSLLDDERRFDVRRRYVVVDDGPDAAAGATRSEVEAFARRSASDVRLLGAGERRALVGWLGADVAGLGGLLDPEVLASASGGRAWNWALLLAAGGTLGLLDDDFRFPLRLPLGAAPEIDLVTEYALEAEFFDGPGALRSLAPIDEDPYAMLSRLLGQPPGALLRRHGASPRSARLRAAASLACLQPPARVAAVCGGIYGALNYDSSVYLSMPNRSTLGSLLRPPFDERRLDGENLWQGRRRPHFMATGVFTPLLLDARDVLPPTGTLGKSDDGLFMALLSTCDPHAPSMAVPAALGHFPPPGRDRRAAAERAAIEDVSTFCAGVALSVAPMLRSADRSLRLAAVAAVMRDLAGGSDAALAGTWSDWRDRMLLRVIQPLYRSLRDGGPGVAPAWTEHVRRMIAANEAALRERSVSPARLAEVRAALSQLGHALVDWPTLWARAGAPLLAQLRPLH
ncbi:MAG: hypothetical protein ACK558_12515 [Pseudomonadota bacterium]